MSDLSKALFARYNGEIEAFEGDPICYILDHTEVSPVTGLPKLLIVDLGDFTLYINARQQLIPPKYEDRDGVEVWVCSVYRYDLRIDFNI